MRTVFALVLGVLTDGSDVLPIWELHQLVLGIHSTYPLALDWPPWTDRPGDIISQPNRKTIS
ncbi:hypothetical protein PF007_g16441 [Phytophthora fragariae]|uniref:Uncharacterized protein n=1 Tax=Phytophthora fragariae TaxID=53985 RepID=A0A6A3RJ59_9STRA|nr:hypothetical protein PF007_g16441 [Phytophthora fragariae]